MVHRIDRGDYLVGQEAAAEAACAHNPAGRRRKGKE